MAGAPGGGPVVERLLDAVRGRRFEEVGRVLHHDVQCRAVLADGVTTWAGGDETAARLARWLGRGDVYQVVSSGREPVGGRWHAWWRVGLAGEWIEQHLYVDVDVDTGTVVGIDLLCSGFQRAEVPPAPVTPSSGS